jgi:hypothetical protein
MDEKELKELRVHANNVARPYGATTDLHEVELLPSDIQLGGVRLQLTVVKHTATPPLTARDTFRVDRNDLRAVVAKKTKAMAQNIGRRS